MISAIKLGKYVTGTSILGIIIGKFCYKKKLYPVIVFEIFKSLKINFYYTILPFDLTVCLWAKGNREFWFDTKEIA